MSRPTASPTMPSSTPAVAPAADRRPPRRRPALILFAAATLVGVWLGVDAPDVSPVAPPAAAATAPAAAADPAPDPGFITVPAQPVTPGAAGDSQPVVPGGDTGRGGRTRGGRP